MNTGTGGHAGCSASNECNRENSTQMNEEQQYNPPTKLKSNRQPSHLNIEPCYHNNLITYRCTYCKDCGLFITQRHGIETIREAHHRRRLQSNPDRIIGTMLRSQNKNRPYSSDCTFLKVRKVLVDWICELGDDLKYTSDTIHTAISYLDCVLFQINIPKNKLQLVGLVCIYLAGKFCEIDLKIPHAKDIYDFSKGVYPIELIHKTELLVLEILGWKTRTVTPPQFIEAFLMRGVVFSSDTSADKSADVKVVRQVRKYSEFFADLALQDLSFNRFSSHIVACACLAGARKIVGLVSFWNDELTELTGAAWEEVSVCFEELYHYFERTFPEMAKKSKAQKVVSQVGESSNTSCQSHRSTTPRSSQRRTVQSHSKQNTSGTKTSNNRMQIETEVTLSNIEYNIETPYKPNNSDSANDRMELSSCKQRMSDHKQIQPSGYSHQDEQHSYPHPHISNSKGEGQVRHKLQFLNSNSEGAVKTIRSAGKFGSKKSKNDMSIEDHTSNSFSNDCRDQHHRNIRRNLLF